MGRGLDLASVAFAIASDRTVLREREALGGYLDGTYRDPDATKARLGDLVGREGYTSASERVAADPKTLGEFRGRTGLLADRVAREEGTTADQVWGAIAPAVRRIGEAEAKAELGYRSSVEAQLAADATDIPRLSERAQAALETIRAAKDEPSRAEAWRAAQPEEKLAIELTEFTAAVDSRFGEEGVRAMLRARPPGASRSTVARQSRRNSACGLPRSGKLSLPSRLGRARPSAKSRLTGSRSERDKRRG